MADEQGGKLSLEDLKERKAQAAEARRPYESDWFLNIAFFQGNQWCAHDGRGLFYPKFRKGQVRLTDNRIQPIVRTEIARLTKSRPGWTAVPRAMDDGASASALTSTRLLEWGYDKLMFAERRREAVGWSRICGAGFIKTTWDPTIGNGTDVLVKPSGEALTNPITGRVARPGELPEIEELDGVETKSIGKGEVSLTVRSPFDIFPDPLATNLADARWIIDESVRSPEYIKEHYDVEIEPDAPAMVGIVESGFSSAAVNSHLGQSVGVRVWELWAGPSQKYPDGCRAVWTDTQILYQGPNEYGEIPYELFPGVDVPGRFWPDAVTTQLRPIQSRWNKMLSQVAENLSKHGNPAALIDKLAGVSMSGIPGEQIHHTGGTQRPPIEYLNPPSMPGYTFNFMEQMGDSFREISGQYETGGNAVPAGVTAASAISLLQEQDATRLGPDVEAIEIALGRVGQRVINLMAKYYTTERIVVVVGDEGVVDVDAFRSDASFIVPDISVQPMSTFPRSLAARQAAIRDILNLMLQYNIPIQAGALAKTLKDMQVGGLENLVATSTADVNQAQREHVDLMRGVKPKVNEVDNHSTHIATHEDFAKTPRFRALPDADQLELITHINLHKQAAVLKTQTDMALAAQVQPAQPPPPDTIQTQPSGDPAPMLEPPPTPGPPA